MAIDVSLSMRATDVEPDRISAAKEAAKKFILEQPKNVRIGIVTFAGTASIVQTPTYNREDLAAAIDRFQLQRQTAIGSGIIMSLAALFPDAGIDLESIVLGRRGSSDGRRGVPIDQADKPKAEAKAQALADAIERAPIQFGEWSAPLHISYGVREISSEIEPEDLLAEADAAMFIRKRERRGIIEPRTAPRSGG